MSFRIRKRVREAEGSVEFPFLSLYCLFIKFKKEIEVELIDKT